MPRPKRKSSKRSLVEWEEAPPQLNVLDWRRRADSFGLKRPPDEDSGEDMDLETFEGPPERLIPVEDPEAFTPQALPDGDEDGFSPEGLAIEPPELGIQGADVDLVRMYLQQVGRRPLTPSASWRHSFDREKRPRLNSFFCLMAANCSLGVSSRCCVPSPARNGSEGVSCRSRAWPAHVAAVSATVPPARST
jgi:hypothetical protein